MAKIIKRLWKSPDETGRKVRRVGRKVRGRTR